MNKLLEEKLIKDEQNGYSLFLFSKKDVKKLSETHKDFIIICEHTPKDAVVSEKHEAIFGKIQADINPLESYYIVLTFNVNKLIAEPPNENARQIMVFFREQKKELLFYNLSRVYKLEKLLCSDFFLTCYNYEISPKYEFGSDTALFLIFTANYDIYFDLGRLLS